MTAGLQVYDTDGSPLFDSSVQGVKFLHTVVDARRVQNTNDIRYVDISDAYHSALIMEVPVTAPLEVMSQLTAGNTMAFLRMTALSPSSTWTGSICVGEYRNGYMRFPLFGSVSQIKELVGGTVTAYHATLVWIA